MFKDEFNYLLVPNSDLNSLEITKQYIKNKKGRRIFNGVTFDYFEDKHIQEMKLKMIDYKINHKATDAFLLRLLYSNEFDIESSIAHYLAFVDHMKKNQVDLTSEIINTFKRGVMYLSGRDKMMRPTIVIQKLTEDIDYSLALEALIVLLIIVEDYCLTPSKIESVNIIVSCKDFSVEGIEIHTLKEIIFTLNKLFPEIIECVYIIQPSLSITLLINSLELSQRALNKLKIIMNEEQLQLLANEYTATQLEKQFGGNLNPPKTFYPFQNSNTLIAHNSKQQSKNFLPAKNRFNLEQKAFLVSLPDDKKTNNQLKLEQLKNQNLESDQLKYLCECSQQQLQKSMQLLNMSQNYKLQQNNQDWLQKHPQYQKQINNFDVKYGIYQKTPDLLEQKEPNINQAITNFQSSFKNYDSIKRVYQIINQKNKFTFKEREISKVPTKEVVSTKQKSQNINCGYNSIGGQFYCLDKTQI